MSSAYMCNKADANTQVKNDQKITLTYCCIYLTERKEEKHINI